MTDDLMLVKFQFFKDIVSTLFNSIKFQIDASTMPFLAGLLERFLCQVMKMFLGAGAVDEATSSYKLIKIDLDKKEISCLLTLSSSLLLLNHFWLQVKLVQHKNKSSRSRALPF